MHRQEQTSHNLWLGNDELQQERLILSLHDQIFRRSEGEYPRPLRTLQQLCVYFKQEGSTGRQCFWC